jgi:hypothetical protein
MPKYNPTDHSIKIHTWATKDKISNGMDNYIDQELFGGNVGHASIVMTLPVNDETKKWIETYCFEQTFEEYKKTLEPDSAQELTFDSYFNNAPWRIPVSITDNTVFAAGYDKEDKLVAGDEIASTSSGFKIDFSWWPGDDEDFSLSNFEEDQINERHARHFEYSDRAKSYLSPEERKHSGTIGSQVMSYAPESIIHQRQISEDEFKSHELKFKVKHLKEMIEMKPLIVSKLKKLNSPIIENSLKLMCNNIGLKVEELDKEYKELNPGTINLQTYKDYLVAKVKVHISKLKEERSDLKEELEDIKDELDDIGRKSSNETNVSKGIPPDHTITLPLASEGVRGLSPEAMLKKMRELSEPNAPGFDLHSKNCSKTTTQVLTAGAEHDPLLKRVLSEEALGLFGTPQQVLGNAQRAREIIITNKENTLLTRVGNSNVLDKAMGSLLEVIMDDEASGLNKGLAGAGVFLVGIAKAPGVILTALMNPTETMNNITDVVSTVFNKANSNALKGLVAVISAVPLVVLAPFSVVEQGLGLLAQSSRNISTLLKQKDPTPVIEDQISTPLASAKLNNAITSASYNSMMAGLVNESVANTVNSNVVTLNDQKAPLAILAEFEIALEDNPKAIVNLSEKDFDTLNKFVREKNDPILNKRFQECCENSIKRANIIGPKTPKQVDEIVDEIHNQKDMGRSPNMNF